MNDTPNQFTRDPDDKLDQLLRQELRWEVPPAVTARLLGLVPGALLAVATPPPRPRPWYSMLVLVLTAAAIGLSLAVAWQILGALTAEFGMAAWLEQLRYAPALALDRLYETMPASRQLVSLIVAVRDQLHWLLLAVVLWLAVDGWQPRLSPQRQPR